MLKILISFLDNIKKISLENFLLNLNFSDEEIKQIAGDLRVEIRETLEKNSSF